MKRLIHTIVLAVTVLLTANVQAQTISPGKATIDKQEFLGLSLNQNISEKYLSKYWETYLEKFGKVKSKRSVYTIEKAAITSISMSPILVTSQITSGKDLSQVFIALNVNGQYITASTDEGYKSAEALLKDFADYALVREDARVADEVFTTSTKNYQKLQKDNENTAKDIEKTEKKLTELKAELEKKKLEADNSLVDLQNKQKTLEAAKSKIR
ncbi:hypothetical protein [Dyadobacter sp. CY356]|uniref:hypothetical protein n=1 Tax=Dyadobacter sp. CY356 TaxID=2906442 RepID=UPI001F394C65|nr:hypothetical protein [Dyadobacter sp. CY356]MCF0057368.1 hypothetical protein [Dyadobacter sp. CY356]